MRVQLELVCDEIFVMFGIDGVNDSYIVPFFGISFLSMKGYRMARS
jgi:hypothetical protein